MEDRTTYWELVKLFDTMSNKEQIRFINNMIDIKTKRNDATSDGLFLVEITND